MRKNLLSLLLIVIAINIYPQSNNSRKHYLNLSVDNGHIIDMHGLIDDSKQTMGLGASVNYLIPSRLAIGAGFNYYTFSASLIDYPHKGCNYFSGFNDGIDNAFHYVKVLVGYRVSIRMADESNTYSFYRDYDRIEGGSFEMRTGLVLYDENIKNISTWIMSPRLVYVYENFELSMYSDLAIGNKETNLTGTIVLTVGFSIGYDIKL